MFLLIRTCWSPCYHCHIFPWNVARPFTLFRATANRRFIVFFRPHVRVCVHLNEWRQKFKAVLMSHLLCAYTNTFHNQSCFVQQKWQMVNKFEVVRTAKFEESTSEAGSSWNHGLLRQYLKRLMWMATQEKLWTSGHTLTMSIRYMQRRGWRGNKCHRRLDFVFEDSMFSIKLLP